MKIYTFPTTMTFHEACRAVVKDCKNPYAIAYAQAGLDYGMTGHEAYIQAQYILSNTGHWRGERAREVKAALKAVKDEA